MESMFADPGLPLINPSSVAAQEVAQELAEKLAQGFQEMITKALILNGFIKKEEQEDQESILQYVELHVTREVPHPDLDLFYHDGFPLLEVKTTFDHSDSSKVAATLTPTFYRSQRLINDE